MYFVRSASDNMILDYCIKKFISESPNHIRFLLSFKILGEDFCMWRYYFRMKFPLKTSRLRSKLCLSSAINTVEFQLHNTECFPFPLFEKPPILKITHGYKNHHPSHSFSSLRCKWTFCRDWCEEIFFVYEKNYIEKKCSNSCFFIPIPQNSKMAATSVIVLDRSNNTTCTINLHGKYKSWKIRFWPRHVKSSRKFVSEREIEIFSFSL